MQLYPNKLDDNLAQGLKPCYLIFGDEPQQKFEAIDKIRQFAKQQGFDEQHCMVAGVDFNWHKLTEASQAMSLFSNRQYFELELPSGKPGSAGAATLIALAAQQSPDTLLLLHGPKIGKDVQRTKWFKALDKQGVYLPCYPVEGRHLQQWISQRLAQAGLNACAENCAMIADFCEGNLLAARQEIDKLALLFPHEPLTAEKIHQSLIDQSRYDVFQLVDTLLAGDARRAIKILYSLESEGVEPNFIVWALIREWQTLQQISFAQQQRQQVNWQKLRVWQNKQSLYQSAIRRLTPTMLTHMQRKLEYMDKALKSESIPRPYIELCHLCLLFVPMALDNIDFTL